MNVIITGGTGFIGRRLTQRLLDLGELIGPSGQAEKIQTLTIADINPPQPGLADDPRLNIKLGDFSSAESVKDLITADTAVVFHLAAVVSGAAEQDFDLGMRVNLFGSYHLLEALRQLDHCPKLIFPSSVAVYGGILPDVIEDDTYLTPQTSYGAQKASIELLINDYSRKGFIDGRTIRLPTIVVRPGKPNKAASSFASSIIREPLQGQPAICPVSTETKMWILSPQQVIRNILHAAELPAAAWHPYRSVALPGITVSVSEMIKALGEITDQSTVDLIQWQPDPFIADIITSWAAYFNPQRGLAMGFTADANMTEIIEAFIADDLSTS